MLATPNIIRVTLISPGVFSYVAKLTCQKNFVLQGTLKIKPWILYHFKINKSIKQAKRNMF